MKLQPKTVAGIIDDWDCMFPGKRSDADLAFLSGKFFKALCKIYSDEMFKAAADIVEAEQEFFPTIAHMRKVCNQAQAVINREAEKNRPALPEYTDQNTEEERKNAAKRLALIGQAIQGKITYAEAEAQMQELVGYAQQ